MRSQRSRCQLLAVILLTTALAAGQEPVPLDFSRSFWLWAETARPEAGEVGFRRTFNLEGAFPFARLVITADARYELSVNGAVIGSDADWSVPETYDVARFLRSGRNVVAVKVAAGNDHPGLLAAFRAVDAQGRLLDLPSNRTWRQMAAPPAGWTGVEYDDSLWPAAAEKGLYGSRPWGRLTRMSAAETRRALEEIHIQVVEEAGLHPARSRFSQEYLEPAFAQRYRQYVTVDRGTGRFRVGRDEAAWLFVPYAQPGGALSPERFDFDRFEQDLKLYAANHLQVGLYGFGWTDLLDAQGAWKKVSGQPRGADLPTFTYAYQVLDHALDRVQANGLRALALLDYRQPLPTALLPETYADKVFLAPSLWRGLVLGQAKIGAYYSERPALVGYALATDALPPVPRVDEPLVLDVYREYLRREHGDIEGLRRAWGVSSAYADLEAIGLPSDRPNDPGAVDFGGMTQWLTIERLNAWVDAMKATDAHHLFAVGAASGARPMPDAAWLRFDLLGTFALAAPDQAPEPQTMPGYGTALAPVSGYRALSGSTISAVLGGGVEAGQRGGHAARLLRHEWVQAVGYGAAGLVSAVRWDQLTGLGLTASSADTVGVQSLGELVEVTGERFAEAEAKVLLVRNPAAAFGNDGAFEERSAARVAEALDGLHVGYVELPPDMIGDGVRHEAELSAYQVVVVPALTQLPNPAFFDRLRAWLEDTSAAGRTLVVGRWVNQNEYFQAVALPGGLSALLGGAAMVTAPVALPGQQLRLEPAGASKVRLARPEGLAVSVLAPVGDGATKVVGWLAEPGVTGSGGLPVVARRELRGNSVWLAGYDLGYGSLPFNDELTGLTRAILGAALKGAGVEPGYQAAPNVSVFTTADNRRAVLTERLGRSAEGGWWQPVATPQVAWSSARTRQDGKGCVEVVTAIAPFQVKLLEAVGTITGVGPEDAATVRVGESDIKPLTVSGDGPSTLALRLWAEPGQEFALQRIGGQAIEARADSDGEVIVPLGQGGLVQVAAAPVAATTTVNRPEDYLMVGRYYEQRREFGRALDEYRRLEQVYAGTDIAQSAQQRKDAILAESGAVVLANYSTQPLRVRYLGPSMADGIVRPGQTETFVLYAGTYQEVKAVPDAMLAALQAPAAESVEVAKGQAILREFGVPLAGKQGEWDPDLNVRAAVSAAEKDSLLASAKALLPAAETGAAGGAAPPQESGQATHGEPTATGPALIINLDVERKDKKKKGDPDDPISVRNATTHDCIIRVDHRMPDRPPQVDDIPLKARGRLIFKMTQEGSFFVDVIFPHNNQKERIGEFGRQGKDIDVVIEELTAEQLAERKQKELKSKYSVK